MPEGRVLVISSNQSLCYHANRDLTQRDFVVVIQSDELAALDMARVGNFDVIIISIQDNNLEKNKVLLDLKNNRIDTLVIVVTDNYSSSSVNIMAKLGIFGFLPSSFEPKNLFLVVKQAMRFKKMTNSIKIHEEKIGILEKQIKILNKKVEDGIKNTSSLYRDLQQAYMRSIKALAHTLDMRDRYTYSHSENVTRYAVIIAEQMNLSFQEVKDIRDACELHDIGKIGIQDSILAKPGELTEAEWAIMKEHPMKGAQILQELGLKNIADLVRQHHEHYDGSGYPLGRKKDEIILGAKIICLADAYDAMTSERSYKNKHFSKTEAVDEIKRNRGRQFDPNVVDMFFKIVDRI